MDTRTSVRYLLWIALAVIAPSAVAQHANLKFLNHNRPTLDAHNCYPYEGPGITESSAPSIRDIRSP